MLATLPTPILQVSSLPKSIHLSIAASVSIPISRQRSLHKIPENIWTSLHSSFPMKRQWLWVKSDWTTIMTMMLRATSRKRSLKSSLPWQKIWMFLSSFTTVTPIRTPWICSKSIVQRVLCTVFPARQRLQKRFSALECTSDLPALSPLKMPVALSKLLQKSHWTGCWSRQTAHTWHRNHSAANAAIPPCSPA